MGVVIIPEEEFYKLQSSIDELKQIVMALKPTPTRKKEGKKPDNLSFDWIHHTVAWPMMNINKQKWNRTFKHVIKHRSYGNDKWIHKPSLDKWMEENAIN